MLTGFEGHARGMPNLFDEHKGACGSADEGVVLDGSFREATRSQALRLRYR